MEATSIGSWMKGSIGWDGCSANECLGTSEKSTCSLLIVALCKVKGRTRECRPVAQQTTVYTADRWTYLSIDDTDGLACAAWCVIAMKLRRSVRTAFRSTTAVTTSTSSSPTN